MDKHKELRAALDAISPGNGDSMLAYRLASDPETIRALLSERDALRDALETIAAYPHARDQEMSAAAMRKIARAALAQEAS